MEISKRVKLLLTQIVAMFAVAGGAMSMCAAQVLDGAMPDFELNSCRFFTTFLIAILMVIFNADRPSMWIPRHNIPYLTVMVLLSIMSNLGIYGAAKYLAVGTSVGSHTAFCVCVSAVVAIWKRKLTVLFAISAIMSVLGVVLISQPLFLFKDSGLFRNPPTNWTSPCKTLYSEDMVKTMDFERVNSSIVKNTTNDVLENHIYTHNISADVIKYQFKHEWKGYVLLLAAAVSYVTLLEVATHIQKEVPVDILLFWNALATTILSILINVLVDKIVIFNEGLCISMVIVHSVGVSLYSVSTIWLAKYMLSVVQALTWNFEFVLLMVAQNTFMGHINPGLGNWVEWLGGALCLVAAVLGPVSALRESMNALKEQYEDLDKLNDGDECEETVE